MSATLYVDVTVRVDGRQQTYRSYTTGNAPTQGEAEVTVDGDMDPVRKTVAASGTAVVWDVTTSPLSDFDVAIITAIDGNLELECVIDDGNENGEVVHVVTLRKGVPFILPSNASRASDHAVDWATDGTADVYEQFRVKNNTSGSVQVEALFVT